MCPETCRGVCMRRFLSASSALTPSKANTTMGIRMSTDNTSSLPAFSQDILKIEISGPEVSVACYSHSGETWPHPNVAANPPHRDRRAGHFPTRYAR